MTSTDSTAHHLDDGYADTSDQRFRIGEHTVAATDPAFGQHLTAARAAKTRPLCACTAAGVPMYIARTATSGLIVKRMPDTGSTHDPDCSSYEPPAELSGLAQVAGQAIDEQPDTTMLRLGFALSSGGGAAPPPPSDTEPTVATADPAKLTLRGLLHYLWDEAGLTRWSANMTGRRNWAVVHHRLTAAAEGKTAKRAPLAASVYVPEPFRVSDKDDIIARRKHRFREFAPAKGSRSQKLMLVVAEVKEFGPARFGHKAVLKQVPDTALMIEEKLFGKIGKTFAAALEMWESIEGSHLILAGTAKVGPTGWASLEQVVLMCTTAQWIPVDTGAELELLDSLTGHDRSFVRSLRYNLPRTTPLAAATLTDTDPVTALCIADTAAGEESGPVDELVAGSSIASWIWDTADPLPSLPTRSNH
ncbi:hypothetical protein CH263_20210 [Rhodococcus sp. 06-1059B-a]|nr:DUF1173 family protein [Rhodococcus sp. 06-1059B-a]OZD60816.1 hypothetical protein CH263_20210 [Rhodococcus sp. 06-1059B-a]